MRITRNFASIVLIIAFLLFVSGCSKTLEVNVPDQQISQKSVLRIDLSDFASSSGEHSIFFSLLSGPGRIEGSIYELNAVGLSAGEEEIRFAALSKNADVYEGSFRVEIIKDNLPPSGSVPDFEIKEGSFIKIPLEELIQDPDGDPVVFSLSGEFNEGFAAIRNSSLIVEARYRDRGKNTLSISASDSSGNVKDFPFIVSVESTNAAPIIEIPDQSIMSGEVVLIDLLEFSSDPDDDEITFALGEGSPGVVDENYFLLDTENLVQETVRATVLAVDLKGAVSETSFEVEVYGAPSDAKGTLTVGGNQGQYETIFDAITAANEGDTILIFPGTYSENLMINKSVNIMGVSREEVLLRPDSVDNPVLYFRGVKEFSVENIRIETEGAGINVSRSSGKVANVDISGGRFCMSYSGDGTNLEIQDSSFRSFAGIGNDNALSSRFVGVYAYGNASITVRNSLFERTGTAVNFSNDLKYSIKDSRFERNSIAISIGGNAVGEIDNNVITGNIENGILLNISSTATLTDNIIFGNARHGLDLYLRSCTDCGCGGTTFRGTVLGSGNVFDSLEEICPADYWEEGFYTIDETLGKETGE